MGYKITERSKRRNAVSVARMKSTDKRTKRRAFYMEKDLENYS